MPSGGVGRAGAKVCGVATQHFHLGVALSCNDFVLFPVSRAFDGGSSRRDGAWQVASATMALERHRGVEPLTAAYWDL